MQIKCSFCATPFAMSNEEAEAAAKQMVEEKLSFVNIHCPKCRRALKVTKKQMMIFPPYKKFFEAKA